MENCTLVFPSSMSAALTYSQRARGRGERIIAASSMKADETAKLYDEWVFLPSIYESTFAAAFTATIAQHNITHFFTPHAVIYNIVERLVHEHHLPVSIIGAPPIKVLNAEYLDTLARAETAQSFMCAIDASQALPILGIASLLHHALQIYGQSSETKIAAIAAAFASAPKGDIIEVGTAWGRSAFVLAFLARHYDVGNVLAIDLWDETAASQKESPDDLERVNRELNWDLIFKIFLIHMLPLASNFNYLRTFSIDGERTYASKKYVTSEEFGKTSYCGSVSIMHIDGNHDYDSVTADVAAWRPHILPGGWLILDDYVWEHGTGPRLAGDELLQKEEMNIAHSFTAGKALFIQFKDAA